MDALPDSPDPEFGQTCASSRRWPPTVALALSSVRRAYNDLLLRAARSSSATLGQRLYGARHRAALSIDEAANAAGVYRPPSFRTRSRSVPLHRMPRR